MLYYRMKICNIKGLCEKMRFFPLNCVGFSVESVILTGENLYFA